MVQKRTYPKSAEAFNAFVKKHGLDDLSELEEKLEVCKGYLRYYVSKGTARLREISMHRLSALAGISGIDPELAAGYTDDVDYYGKAAEEKALDPRMIWITNLRKSLGLSRRAMSLAMGRNPMYIANIEKINKPKPQSLECIAKAFHVTVPEELMAMAEKDLDEWHSCLPPEKLNPFARDLRERRERLDMTPEQLAEKVGVNWQYFIQVEGGNKRISPAILEKTAHALGLKAVPEFWKEALRKTGRGGVDNPAVKPLEELPPFGRTIRKLRSRKGWSLTEAAEAIGLKTASWKQIEYGKSAVSDERMLAMAKAFGFSQIPLGWRRLRRESRMEPQPPTGADAQHLSAFGAVLRAERHKRGMTLKDLAKAIGVDETTISEIEYGRIKLTTERLKAICWALGYKKVPQHFIAALELEPQWSLKELSDLVEKPL